MDDALKGACHLCHQIVLGLAMRQSDYRLSPGLARQNSPFAIATVLFLTVAIAGSATAAERTGFSVSAGIGASIKEDRDGDEDFDGSKETGSLVLIGLNYLFQAGSPAA